MKTRVKDFLYRILSVQTFHQLGNTKIMGLSNLYMLMSVSIAIGATVVGFYGINNIEDYTLWLPLIPFIILGLLFVTNKWTVGVVSKETQDSYPLTQLARFRDPAYSFQKMLYPNAEARQEELEGIWEDKFGITFDEANANAPFLQRARVLIMLGAAFGGVLLGTLIGII